MTSKTAVYLNNVDILANLLADHFNQQDAQEHGYKYISAAEYRDILISERNREGRKRRGYNILPRTITIDEWHAMKRSFPIFNGNMGYVFRAIQDNKRLYPSGDIARQTIGRYDTIVIKDKTDPKKERKIPGTGLELQFNNYLTGQDGLVKEQSIAHGFWARAHDKANRSVENGANVITTLDAGLQRMAHERLDTMLRRQKASFGVAMVMEVETGNILCMVSLSSAKERGTTYSERVNNHALKTAISPGSTMKLATAMALLEIGGYTLDTKVNTEHSQSKVKVKVGNANIEDSHDAAGKNSDGYITLKEAFAHSSNVYFAKAVYERFKDNPAEYTDFIAKLRFNDYVGLESYGEVRSRMPLANTPEWNINGSTSTRLPRLAYGYELDVPPIHMLTFYNGVANEGRMVAPRFVDRIERNGEVIERMPVVTLIKKMCSKETLRQLDTCLAAAAARSGHYFRDLAIPFGCKTGTAQLWSTFVSESRIDNKQMENGINGPSDHYYYGSIICTMPQENPRYTVLVGVCKQTMSHDDPYYGIDLAGPVAADMLEYIYTNDPSLHYLVETPETEKSPTFIKAGKTSDVKQVSRQLSTKSIDESNDKLWSRSSIDEEGTATIIGIDIKEGVVPNVYGMGLSDALYLLESVGLEVTHSGVGRVKSQSIPAGKNIKNTNTTIHLTLGQ